MNNMTTISMAKRITPLLAALLLVACAAPEFKQPAVDVPVAYKESATQTAADGTQWKQGQPAEAQPRGEWWLAFNDPTLNQLILDATAANQNLAVAAARVKQARALAGIAQADRIPQVGVNVGAERIKQSPLVK